MVRLNLFRVAAIGGRHGMQSGKNVVASRVVGRADRGADADGVLSRNVFSPEAVPRIPIWSPFFG